MTEEKIKELIGDYLNSQIYPETSIAVLIAAERIAVALERLSKAISNAGQHIASNT